MREESEWKIGEMYREGWIVIVADGSPVCCLKNDCDGSGGTDLPGVRRRAWQARECVVEPEVGETVVEQEAVTKMGVWTLGSQMGHNQMESVGLQEVMVCVAAKNMDHAGRSEEWVAHPTEVCGHFGVDCDISVRVPCANVGTIVEETGTKKVGT